MSTLMLVRHGLSQSNAGWPQGIRSQSNCCRKDIRRPKRYPRNGRSAAPIVWWFRPVAGLKASSVKRFNLKRLPVARASMKQV